MPPNPESEKVASDPGYLSDPFRTLETITSGIHKKDSPVTERITTPSATTVEDTDTTGSSGHGFAVPISLVLFGYLNYTVLFVISYIKELLYGLGPWRGKHIGMLKEGAFRSGYAPLYSTFESFYTRNVYRRIKECFNNVIGSVPGASVTFIDRKTEDDCWTFEVMHDKRIECINVSSYNYLGYAQREGECIEAAVEAVHSHGLSSCSSSAEVGRRALHAELEATVAEFLGTEDSITCGMGFATNALNLPRLVGPNCLVLSDEFNHASIITGLRLSGATIKVFKHNNVQNLEQILRNAIIKGHPRTHRPWKKVLIVVEGVYSMEGTICRLPEIIDLKKKYRAYLYLDEAHSVGAMGPRGRGVVDYFGCDPRDVDVMMGTFTKSFGAAGGYIAGSRDLIDYLRINSEAATYCSTVSPPVALQVITALRSIMDPEKDGLARIKRLARNTRYFRAKLKQMGFVVSGDDASPVVPLMLFMPSVIVPFVKMCRERGVATVAVGFPATRLVEERARFCLSAGHTKEMLDKVLQVIDEVGEYIGIKYASNLVKNRNQIITY